MRFDYRLVLFAVVVFIVVLVAPRLSATDHAHMTLLTVATSGNISYGGTADLDLTIRPGSGRVFLATFPFSKLDTQISTRFANEVACSMVDVDCDRYDFFYTITADSTIIGGPSAGAALAAITVSLLDNQPIRDDVAVTGTISAGGIIGPVGGVDEKVAAAADAGISTVVIPRWDASVQDNLTNATDGTGPLTHPSNITVIEAGSLSDVLYAVTGKRYMEPVPTLAAPDSYEYIMGEVATQLCNRSRSLLLSLPASAHASDLYNASVGFLSDAGNASEARHFYSQASYCFSANLRLRELQLSNFSEARVRGLAGEVRDAIEKSRSQLDARELRTFADLQTKAIVDERLREAEEYLDGDNVSSAEVAYAMERYRSGVIWSNFFELPGERLQLDESHLKAACEAKLSEVEERKGYLAFLFGSSLVDEQEVSDAYSVYHDGDYALCLFKASKAKAQVDMVISSIAMSQDDLPALTDEKLSVAKTIISREMSRDRFPIMGYSYYEYAGSLRDDDPYVAALFASYALEMGDLSLYFSAPSGVLESLFFLLSDPFIIGFLAGLIVTFVMFAIIPGPRGGNRRPQRKRARRRP